MGCRGVLRIARAVDVLVWLVAVERQGARVFRPLVAAAVIDFGERDSGNTSSTHQHINDYWNSLFFFRSLVSFGFGRARPTPLYPRGTEVHEDGNCCGRLDGRRRRQHRHRRHGRVGTVPHVRTHEGGALACDAILWWDAEEFAFPPPLACSNLLVRVACTFGSYVGEKGTFAVTSMGRKKNHAEIFFAIPTLTKSYIRVLLSCYFHEPPRY